MEEFFVYIMSNNSWNLYVGVTNNLERRVLEHKMKLTKGHTYRHNLTMLVYMETFPDPSTAIAREKELKGWLRRKKLGLVLGMNPEWKDLSAGWYR